MFKGHPKGLYVAFFANMGERFGYYTMLSIFTLYLQAKFGWTAKEAGQVYGGFLFGIYFLPLLGGLIADNWWGYGKTIVIGTIIMFSGYAMLAIPGQSKYFIFGALAIISLGTGFFKGNLQALVGNMYDDPKYDKVRDSAFNIFYMGINIGAFFAPSAATGISNLILKKQGLIYSSEAIDLANKFKAGIITAAEQLRLDQIGHQQLGSAFQSISAFAQKYIEGLSASYNAGFAIASLSMIISLLIFIGFRKHYIQADVTHKQQKKAHAENLVVLSREETKQRLIALGLVFLVVMFFWMAFHQNGFTLTIFAKNYTVSAVNRSTAVFFNLQTLFPLLIAIVGFIMMFGKETRLRARIIWFFITAGGVLLTYLISRSYTPDGNPISPQIFQQFNPLFIVFLTPVIIGYFGWLQKRGKEPSSPRKIGIGMILAAVGFFIMVMASRGLQSPSALQGGVSPVLRSPYWLISTYFTLTIAELFLSPIGISFVSKVAPPQFKGLMQGGWFAATAIGTLLAGLIGAFWDKWELWQFFLLLVVLCLLSAIFIFTIIKKLYRIVKSK